MGCSQGTATREQPEEVVAPVEIPWIPKEPADVDPNTPVGRHGQLHLEGTQIVDEHGAAVQLKGVSTTWLNDDGSKFSDGKVSLEFMRDDWNLTVYRVAMGADPESGGGYVYYPELYGGRAELILQHAIDLGVYVILDWHDHEAEGHQAEAIDFFSKMATKYGHFPNVIYETYNEPIRTDWSTEIKPYHEAVVAAIRAIDPDNIIVLGSSTWSQDVDKAAADPVAGENLMYTLHFYSCTHTQWLRDRASAALATGLPIFVTEWGAAPADGGTNDEPPCLDEGELWHRWMKDNGVSWAAWKLIPCKETSCILEPGALANQTWPDSMLHQGHGPFVVAKMRE